MALLSPLGREPRDCSAESSAWRRLRGEREGGDMVVRAVWKEVLLGALEEGGMGFGKWWVGMGVGNRGCWCWWLGGLFSCVGG